MIKPLMPTQYKKYLVTSALPYANGPLHFGHLAGVYLPADIYTRHRRLQGKQVLHICGSDEHGVAIMISAEKEKMSYQAYVDKWHAAHHGLFKKLDIEFDFFGRTSAQYHATEVKRWFKKLYDSDYIGTKTEKQLYCNNDQRFLPDRYVEGICYSCGYKNARGDECPNCGEWIEPIRLKEPVCKICNGHDLSVQEVEHYYLLLTKLEKQFKEWFVTKTQWKPVVTGFVNGLLEKGAIDRAISRTLEWGIDVPLDQAKGKKLYVWFDAPIGYVSNTKQYLAESKSSEDYILDWWNNNEVEISHFIGKDNIIFHAYIWPCMAIGTEFIRPPTELPANQFVNFKGKQFSKSSGEFVDTKKALETFGSDSLRFYLCSIIPENSDSSFSWDGLASMNEEFGNKIGNFVHRTLTFLVKNWESGLSAESFSAVSNHEQLNTIRLYHQKIIGSLDCFQFTRAHAELILFAQAANEFFHGEQPWKKIKTDRASTEQTIALSVIYILAMGVLLKPFVPKLSSKILDYFKGYVSDQVVAQIYQGKLDLLTTIFQIKGFKPAAEPKVLIPRIEFKQSS